MFKKTVVVIAASALAFGMSASAATKHYKHRHHATHATAAKVEPMKSVAGQNPIAVAPSTASAKPAKLEPQKTVPGQNPIAVAPASGAVKGAKKPETITGSNPMVVPK